MNKKEVQKKITTFRLSEETLKELEELSTIWGMNRTQILESLVSAEYMRMTTTGRENIETLVNQLNEINVTIKKLQNNNNLK